ncbi:MAG: hypothetical protein IJD97_08070 [Clostridia bacterium]|nr:hypothetical protein [Clostridia bacterium]
MKKVLKLALISLMILSLLPFTALAKEVSYKATDSAVREDAPMVENYVKFTKEYGYFEIKDVDLTGINSVSVTSHHADSDSSYDGDYLFIRLDSPKGKAIGTINIDTSASGVDKVFKGSIEKTDGVHNVYIMSFLSANGTFIKDVTFSSDVYNGAYVPADRSKYQDTHSSTWALTDDYGVRAADFEEVGPLDESKKVGIFYWTWHERRPSEHKKAFNNTEFIKIHPEAKYDYDHRLWPTNSVEFYWNEPLFGYYSGTDYWVMRKHATMLKNAGVDALFFDATNGNKTWRSQYEVLFSALYDSLEAGNDVPKVAFMCNFSSTVAEGKSNLKRLYSGAYKDGKYSDLWFMWEGKPVVMAYPEHLKPVEGDELDAELMEEMLDFFTFRPGQPSYDTGSTREDHWGWLEMYPQNKFGDNGDGTYEQVTVGVSANFSYISKSKVAMNDQYVTGRGYTTGLGDDKSPEGKKKGYFFREQLSRALEVDPEFMFITGWNEWRAGRYQSWGGTPNAFPDQFDDNGSRDMEPSKGELKDLYYCYLVDAVRRFKGAEMLPEASAEITIDLTDLSAWDAVTPEYYNDKGTYTRDNQGFSNIRYTNDTMRNNPIKAKVARDKENIYFMAECEETLKGEGDSSFMNLYIDSDRLHKTGWEGYDYVIAGTKVYALSSDGTRNEAGNAEYKITGSTIAVKVNRALINLSGTLDFEFKWTDNVVTKDILDFYSYGCVAPMGRFNYRYKETKSVSLSDAERASLKNTGVFKAGSAKMFVNGGMCDLSPKNPGVAAFEKDGTLYIPADTFDKVMGFGRARTEYDANYDMLFTHNYELSQDEKEVDNYIWTATKVGSSETRINGRAGTLSHPVIAENGQVYIPLSLITDCYGWNLYIEGNGVYAIGYDAVSSSGVKAAAAYLN